MIKRLLMLATTLMLASCGGHAPPATPNGSVWGIPIEYRLGDPAGDLVGLAEHRVGGCVVTVLYADPWLLGHEATHCWVEQHGVPDGWEGVACIVQEPWRCTAEEALADWTAVAIVKAGCLPGDLGWPGGEVGGCVAPDPASTTRRSH